MARSTTLAVPVALLGLGLFEGGRVDYLAVAAAWAALSLLGERSRGWLSLALPLVITGVLYDHFTLVEGLRGPVHVMDVRALEAALFGLGPDGELPHRWLAARTHPALDLITGFAYMTYLFEVFLLAVWWRWRREHERSLQLAWGFLAANLIGMVVWTLLPVAPPWYADLYGAEVLSDVPASAAGAARFDAMLGIGWFEAFYARSTNVFGAMPSLHVAYPTLAVSVAIGGDRRLLVALLAFAVLVAFSAVYLSHHYLLDVLAGGATGIVAHRLVAWARSRRRPLEAASTAAEVKA